MILHQDININGYIYQAYLFKNENINKEFIYFLNYDIVDNMPVIHDIYFIDNDIRNEVWESLVKNNINQTTITYPITNNYNINEGFATNVHHYNTENKTIDINNTINVKADKIRIYRPVIKKSINAVIYVYAYVNSVKIHLFCRNYDTLKIDAQKEFQVGQNYYTEYVDFYIPNIENLLHNENIYINALGIKYQFNKIVLPFYVDGNTIKYINEDYYALTNTISVPITLMIWPYGKIDTNLQRYIVSGMYTPNSDTFNKDNTIRLGIRLDFTEDEELCVYGKFSFNSFMDEKYVEELYCTIYGVEYKNYIENPGGCCLKLEIATDNLFKNIIFSSDTDDNVIDFIEEEFTIPIQGFYTSWDEYPDILTARVTFIDAINSIYIYSNNVCITKEYFKFLIKKYDKNGNIDVMELQDGTFNLIDKMQCEVINKQIVKGSSQRSNASPKVIIKPMFYKVADLYSINLKSQLTQNIGVNLADYMSKVEAFKMIIDGTTYTEIARNDAFVIFKINASVLSSTTGTYHIMTQDNDYISSGKYTIS